MSSSVPTSSVRTATVVAPPLPLHAAASLPTTVSAINTSSMNLSTIVAAPPVEAEENGPPVLGIPISRAAIDLLPVEFKGLTTGYTELAAKINTRYPHTFEPILETLAILGNISEVTKEARRYKIECCPLYVTVQYLKLVNHVLQGILGSSDFRDYCRSCPRAGSDPSRVAQAVKQLATLALQLFKIAPPILREYPVLVDMGRKIATLDAFYVFALCCGGLAACLYPGASLPEEVLPDLNSPENVLLNLNFLAVAQRHLNLPFNIPLLVPSPLPDNDIIKGIANVARKLASDPAKMYKMFYLLLPYWRDYINGGYKNDHTVRGTPLEKACQDIEAIQAAPSATDELPEATSTILVTALQQMLAADNRWDIEYMSLQQEKCHAE